MKTRNTLTIEQAMRCALVYARIENETCRCLSSGRDADLYHFVVHTAFMRYEFYVDAGSGDVLGLDTQPLTQPEILGADSPDVPALPPVA